MRSAAGARLRRRSQAGQALVYVAIFLAVLVTALFALFDLGKLTMAKIQAQNGADAAALAAVSVKVSVHHTRELAYLAMTEQGLHARVELLYALSSFDDPSTLQRHVRRAEAYLKRLRALHDGLLAYNAWVDQEGPALVAEAARLGYVANIRGMNSHRASGAALDARNALELDQAGALRENSTEQRFIGQVNYPKEGLGKGKDGGKSFVEVVPHFCGMDWSIFGVGTGGEVEVPAWAAAGAVRDDELAHDPQAGGQAFTVSGYGLHWYTPRLVRTGRREDGGFGGPHAGGGIESEH